MTDPSPSTGRPPNAGHAAPGNSAPAGKASTDDVLDVLQEFEIGLESLKQLYAQRQALADDLKRRREQMDQADAELRSRREELSTREREITRSSSLLGERWKQLEEREQSIAALRRDVDGRLADLNLRERTISSQKTQVAELQRSVEQRAAEADARHADLDRITNELEQRGRMVADQAKDLEAKAAAAHQALLEAKSEREALDAQRADVERKSAQTAALRESLEAGQRELDARRAELDRDRAKAESLAAELAQQQRRSETASHDAQRLREECESLTRRLADADRRLASQADQFAAQRREHETAVDDLRRRTRELETQLAEASRSGDQQTARAEAGDRAVEELRSRLAEAERALAAAQASALEKDAKLRDALASCEELRKKLAEAEEARLAAPTGEARDNRGTHADHDALAEKLRTACEALVQLRNERAELVEKARTLESELARARRTIDQLKAASPGAKSTHPVAMQRRKQRLSVARELILKRLEKVRKAEDALATRFQQCERVLAMRQELADARELLNAARRNVERTRATGKAAALIFYGTAAAALLGVLSWFGTQAIVPGEYAARAVIAADDRGRSLGPGEYAEWQSFHESMVEDPRFIEVAAERMERRGILDLARAPDLKSAIKEHLSYQSGSHGELSLEWRDKGSERSFRVLDTFVTALTSHSNAARERRVDGAVTKITQTATQGTERLDTDYRWIAAAAWGGSMLLSFGLAVLFWRSIAKAKATFEGSATVDATLDTRRWQLPTR
ncbi:MAG: hypothetical protein AMXMBFR58_27960 [Phycisphaerae bacterium]